MEGYKNKLILNFLSLLVLLLTTLSSCSVRRGLPLADAINPLEASLKDGQVLFNNYCSSCHPNGTSGLGPAMNNKPLPRFLVRFQIRHGLGVMPAFKRDVLEKEEVKKIAAYVKHLRKQD